jgi:TPR repeat protein
VQEQHRLIHEEAVRKAHEAAVKAAGHYTNSENTQSHTVTSTETVQSVHTEVVDNASGETIKEKLEVTKKVVDSNGDVREDHFVAEMEDEDLQLEESAESLEEDPKAAEEPAEKEVQKIPKSEEDSSDDGLENSGEETQEAKIQEDEELQKRMEDFSESLGSILTDVVKTQRKLRKEMEDDEEEAETAEINTKVPYTITREGFPREDLREIDINGVKIITADNRKSTDKKVNANGGVFIPPTKVMREHEVDGIKIMTTVDLENKGNPDLPIDEQDEDWQVYDRNEQLLLRRKRFLVEKQINPTFTGYASIDALSPTVGKSEDDCRRVWIFNEKPFLKKCIKEFHSEQRPWCSLDEVFQGNFVFCDETEEERLEREKYVESLNLFNDGMAAIGGWDSRRSVVKAGFEKIERAYELGYVKASGHLAWAKLNGYFLKMNVQEAKELALGGAERGQALDQAVLGFMYATGVGFPANQAKAFLYWSFAANSGIMSADMALGFRYTKGVGVAYNCEAAMIHYQRAAGKVMNSISFSGGNAKAKWNLEQLNSATFDESGLHDINLINYYELLANQGEVEAMVKLGEMFVDRAYEVITEFFRSIHDFFF